MSWVDEEGKIHRNRPSAEFPQGRHSGEYSYRRRIYCSERSYAIAGILAIEFGFLGIHNFYIKYTKKGFVQLAISMMAFFLYNVASLPSLSTVAFLCVWIWGIIDGVLLFTGKTYEDGEGSGFWHSWLADDASTDFVRPDTYPHKKAWIITSVISLAYLLSFLLPFASRIIRII